MSLKNNSFQTHQSLQHQGKTYHFHSLKALEKKTQKSVKRLPFSLKILLENLLRQEDGVIVREKDILALLAWDAKAEPQDEIQFMPGRVVLQDFTGVPAVADLAAMRVAVAQKGKKPSSINPLIHVDLVIDHSVQVDFAGTADAQAKNSTLEAKRNHERYEFLKWAQTAFENLKVVPPNTGIVHQVNLEYLASVAMTRKIQQDWWVFPDSLIGADSHTTMINGLGCLAWGVGGIEAEAAMLGQPCCMLIPQVIGVRLTGAPKNHVTATDIVLTLTEILRKKGVVGKFVEYFGEGVQGLSLADRATIANMAPEYGATIGMFPVDSTTLKYLEMTNRPEAASLAKDYFELQGMLGLDSSEAVDYTDIVHLDLSTVEASLAGPSRPQDRVVLGAVPKSFQSIMPKGQAIRSVPVQDFALKDGAVVIAAITSCTNTSNPGVLIGAGLLARNAVKKGLKIQPWVKASLAPGSPVVTDYLKESGLLSSLEALKFHVVGYGCTTCIGNSGPLSQPISDAITKDKLHVAAVLSGNRNFEGRVHPLVRANYLASPALVVAYAIVGDVHSALDKDPLGNDTQGNPVYLKDIWPDAHEIESMIQKFITRERFEKSYKNIFEGPDFWKKIPLSSGELYPWNADSTYIKQPPFFDHLGEKVTVSDIHHARVLAYLGDSVTTDHISPAGSISKTSAAGKYLESLGVSFEDFNAFGARRGNHEVMVRGTFGSPRLKNALIAEQEGPMTFCFATNSILSIYDAAMEYKKNRTSLIILAGKEYGTGSSRDWAAKGPKLLGVKAVIAESFERIHRSNLVGMGVLPLQFMPGESAKSLGLVGKETFDILDLASLTPSGSVRVVAHHDKKTIEFTARCRIDTPNEIDYYRSGGILPYVMKEYLEATS